MNKLIESVNTMDRTASRLFSVLLLIIIASALCLLFTAYTGKGETLASLSYYLPEIIEHYIISFTAALGGCLLYDYESRRKVKGK